MLKKGLNLHGYSRILDDGKISSSLTNTLFKES